MRRREALRALAWTVAGLAAPRSVRGAAAPQGKTLILIPCCIRKRAGGEADLRWAQAESALQRLSPESAARLMDARRALAEHFGYAPATDVGGMGSVPLRPACVRFDGNLYRKMNAWDRLRRCAGTEVLIVSAL